jgi:hypothetical protein
MTRRNASIFMTLAALMLTVPTMTGAQTAPNPAVDITLASKPTPPRTGSNTFDVTLKDAAGKPVTDADVWLQFYMAGGKEVASKKLPIVAKQ